MFISNRYLSALNLMFTGLEQISEFDYVAVGEKVINFVITAVATIVAVSTYVYTAAQLWWDSHGTTVKQSAMVILTQTVRFTFIFADACGAVYHAGRKLRPVANRWVSQVADSTFYTLAEAL